MTAIRRGWWTLSVCFLLASPALAQLREIETNDLRLVFYDVNHTYLAPQLMRSFENAFAFHQKRFGYRPDGKVTVLLEDFGDYGHGGADVIPSNRINVGLAPFSYIYETIPSNERMSWIMNHELAHVFEMDGSRASDRFFRRWFGAGLFPSKVTPNAEDPISMGYAYLTTPRRYSPRWYHEGVAVFLETWMSGGLGRALGGYDEMVFRAMVRDDSRIYLPVGLEAEGTTNDFQVGANSYLYGTRFLTYLAEQHGPQKVIDWAASGPGSKAYFAAQFRHVFKTGLEEEWSRWILAERQWQNQNLAQIRQYPVTPLRRLSERTLGSVSRSFYDDATGKIYAAVRYPGPMAHLAAIDSRSGAITRLHDVEGAALYYVASLAFDSAGRKLFFTTDNNDWRDLNVYDLNTGKASLLIRNFRAGDIAFNPVSRSLWGVRHLNGLSIVLESTAPYRQVIQRFPFPYGVDLFDLNISPDGKWLCGMLADSSGRQKLVKFSLDKLRAGDGSYDTIHDFEFSTAGGLRFSADGNKIFGASYFTGVSNIFRVDVASGRLDVLSNAETGLFWPLPLSSGSDGIDHLFAYEYTAAGFVPVSFNAKPLVDVNAAKYFGQQVVEKFPIVREWKLPPPAEVDVAGLTTKAGDYIAWRNLKPAALYPIVQGYKDTQSFGARMDFADGLGLAALNLTAGYSPDPSLAPKERGHFAMDYRNWGWHFNAAYNNADFYDLFGPTKVSLKGYLAKLAYKKNLRYKPPRTLDLDWSVAGYAGLDRLPDYQNVALPITSFFTGKISLTYARLERSLGAVDDEKGIRWQLATQGNYATQTFFPRVYGTLDYGFLTPLRNSPIWIRSSLGKSFGDRTSPFANFYFGGFQNNWIDHLAASRYREYYTFPGVAIDQIGSADFAKSMVEWNLPPLRFRTFGTPYFYCNWARFTLFSSVLEGNLTSAPNRLVYGNAGTQLDFRLVIASYLNTTFSVGYAEALENHGRTSSEVMVSLKLL